LHLALKRPTVIYALADSEAMAEDLETLARKYALQNALEYDGKANPGAVIGKVMAADHALRSKSSEVGEVVNAVISEINSLSIESQRAELETLAPELLIKKKKEKIHELPDLEGGENGVVMRFAPGPSGPLHIGHTRAAILNDEYVKKYGGKYIIRLEDTNPPTVLPEAYDLIPEDLDWLGVNYHEIINQSSRFQIYYEHAEDLLKKGHAYMCGCIPDNWRTLKENMKPCTDRNLEPGVHLDLWERMLAGEFKPGEMSLVVKTELDHPNPAVRDFVALRLVEEPHPLTGDEFCVYPLYNFSVAIDDHLMGMTHVLRGKDHLNNTLRQEYIYEHMGWKKPAFIHYGWVSIEDTELSTREIKASIEEGKFSGWKDVRLGTVAALARRGIRPGAIRQYWIEVGVKAVDIKFSWQNLYAYNKDIIDPVAKRYFFVWNPKKIIIQGTDEIKSVAPLHPENPDLGNREVTLSGDPIDIQVVSEDIESLSPETRIRFKDLCNSISETHTVFNYAGNDLSFIKEGAKIIHWVGPDAVPACVHMPDGEIIEGLVEKAAVDSIDEVVQFERFGFVKLEKGNEIEAYFAHK
jgi:glutamyl-tRNA synthetase